MKKILLFFLILSFINIQGQVTFENAFPNLTFNYPVDIQNSGVSGDNRLFVVEQPGRIRVFQNQANASSSSLFLDITNKVNYTQGQEKGLLGLAFHPNYNQNGFFYVSYTGFNGGFIEIIIERYSVNPNNPNQANPNSGCEVLSFVKNQGESNHNGGSITFGSDGYLYISVGDGGGAGDPQGNAQNLNSLFGKILRIDINAPCPGYAIPSDNPLVSSTGRDEIYAWGLRNTWRMNFDFQTNRLWGGDVGQGQFEEINLIENGRNYGWNRFEAFSVFNSSTPNPSNPTYPIFNNNHSQNDRSITGGFVYRGSEIGNGLFGKYVYGDFVSGRIWSLDYNPQTGATDRTLLFNSNFSVSSFGQDINNELYFAAYGFSGRIYKLIEGTFPSCSISTGNCSITISGLSSGEIAKVFDASFQEVWTCTPFGNNPNPCSPTETITGLENGTYFVQACGATEPYSISCGNMDPCANQGGDSDGDGICNNQDCQPNNNAFPATPGTTCDDGNSNTNNDVITSDGCGCAGTPTNGTCSVTTGNCSITLNGLNSGDFIKVFDDSFQEVWRCSQFGNNPSPCNPTETVTGLENGTYFVQACGSLDAYLVSGCGSMNPCAAQGGDSDGDGICNNQDCQPNNNAFPATPGTSCDDGNPNTNNDIVTSDGCGCAGTPTNATCSVTTGNCSITLNGLNSDDFIKVFNDSFQEVWRCSQFGNNPSPCNSTETVTGLSDGTYFVQACGSLDPYVVSGCGSTTGNDCSSISNVAQGKTAEQSSTITAGGITGSASKAVDGNTNGTFFTSSPQNSSVAATQNQSQPYWQVDLQSNHFIEEINIYNRTDGSARTTNAYVLISDQPFTSSSLSNARSQADYEFFISGLVGSPSIIMPQLEGRYVRVQMQSQGNLTLGEVEVMGCISNNLNNNSNTLIILPNLDFDLKSIIIFPNPAQDEINVDLKSFEGQKALIQIFDPRGILIKKHHVNAASAFHERIDLKGIVNGLYFLTVKIDGHKLVTKPLSIIKTY